MAPEKQRKFGTIKSTDKALYWLERRLHDKGRGVVMRWHPEEGLAEAIPETHAARSKVHEYGGGEFCVGGESVFFTNSEDQQIYECKQGGRVTQITDTPHYRYADLEYDQNNHRLIAVAEHHAPPSKQGQDDHPASHPENLLVYIGLNENESGGHSVIDDSADFYASPRLSPDGKTLAWLEWNLPDMPWQSARLRVSPLEPLQFAPTTIMGGKETPNNKQSASFGPQWDQEGRLLFVNDVTGYGQLYVWEKDEVKHQPHQDQTTDNLQPLWVFGMESHTVNRKGETTLTGMKNGELCIQHITQKEIKTLTTAAEAFTMPHRVNGQLAGLASTNKEPQMIALIDESTGEVTPLRSAYDTPIDTPAIGVMKKFQGNLGEVYGIYYPPDQGEHETENKTPPPAIITIHGGPTAMVERGCSEAALQWTSKGYAVFEVDYSGSSGYGKAYRTRLDGKWGSADVDDIIAAAQFLIDNGLADPSQLILTGGSSGGYTALMALVKSNLFQCAACKYPVTDLGQLLKITHKFESGYIYSLTGTTEDNAEAVLKSQAIEQHLDALSTPVIFFQGLDDKVVPPAQPRAVYQALKAKGIKTELIEFEGEGHGFCQASTLNHVVKAQERFFKEVLLSAK